MARGQDVYDLQRFLEAQSGVYEQACAELRAGRKRSHWMWFVFPQIHGLGSSPMAVRYAISSLDEARAYLEHDVLGPRLRESAGIVVEVQGKTVLQAGAEQSMASVAAGQVEVTFGLVSEILPAPGVQLAGPIPPEFQKRIIMSAGIASSTKNREAASAIIKSLSSAASAAMFKSTGLDPITKDK